MAAKNQCINSERTELKNVIPLKMPFTVNIFLTTLCDFKCNYCYQTLGQSKIAEKFGATGSMTLDTFKKVIDGLAQFPDKLKTVIISGHGEPLMNPDVAEMIAYVSKKDVSERIELITNANRLTHKMSDELIDAGLTSLRVSIQGVSAKKYREISNVDIDFDAYVEQLNYFYNRKQGHNCAMYCKTVDAALGPGDRDIFFDIFGKCSDLIHVENIVKVDNEVKYNGLKGIEKNTNKNDVLIEDVKVCPIPFYTLDIFEDGTIANCHMRNISTLGNVESLSICEAWNSQEIREFWLGLLNFAHNPTCRSCHLRHCLIKKGDFIDTAIDELKERILKAKESLEPLNIERERAYP